MLGFLFGIDKKVTIFAAFNIKLHRRASEPAVQVGIFLCLYAAYKYIAAI